MADYNLLNLHSILDYDKFNAYSITHHSTAIEGATLTQNETRLLLDEDATPKGKPLTHSLMVKDHYAALQFVLQKAKNANTVTTNFIKEKNAFVMKHTGAVYNTPLGTVDGSKYEFRKENVSASGFYFINYDKVPSYTDALVKKINENIKAFTTFQEKLELSFAVHFDLVSIHPFYDGNGRTSRLLMNYLQAFTGIAFGDCLQRRQSRLFYGFANGKKRRIAATFLSIYVYPIRQIFTARNTIV